MIALAAVVLAAQAAPATQPAADGLQPPIAVASRHVAGRLVQVWLPPGYARGAGRYPVVYLHDGQYVFDNPAPPDNASWGVHRALAAGIASGRMRPAILVAVWNTPKRMGEYMPDSALTGAGPRALAGLPLARGDVRGDAYLRFLVEELKPRIDRAYRTRPAAADTMLMGASLGGLISAYALVRYPRVFGAAACLSTSWPIGDGFPERWFAAHLPDPHRQRLWFDYGTGTNDGVIEAPQRRLDALARRRGFTVRSWTSRGYPGARHSEVSWRARVADPLMFLLGR